MNPTCFRGELYFADLGHGIGSEQEGYRPVVILQNDVGNAYSPTTIIAPISRKHEGKAKLPTHYSLEAVAGLEAPSIVLLEQIRVIDKKRLDCKIGRLPAHHISGIEQAMSLSVGLPRPENKIILCLCSICARNFYNSGAFIIRRVDPYQVEQEPCSYCNHRTGYDYEISEKNSTHERSKSHA